MFPKTVNHIAIVFDIIMFCVSSHELHSSPVTSVAQFLTATKEPTTKLVTVPTKQSSLVFHRCLLRTEEGQEHVESDLDTVDEQQPVLAWDDGEVDGVYHRPELPGSLAGGQQVVLDLVSDGRHAVAVDKSKVREEDGHEDGAPTDLVDRDLHGDGLGILSGDLRVQPVVEVMSGGAVVQETEGTESDESLPIEWSRSQEDLMLLFFGIVQRQRQPQW